MTDLFFSADEEMMIEPKAVDSDQESEDFQCTQTFADRVVEDRITWTGFDNWEYKFVAEAVDVATGITVTSGKYLSQGGAKKHARADLKEILLQKRIIQEGKY